MSQNTLYPIPVAVTVTAAVCLLGCDCGCGCAGSCLKAIDDLENSGLHDTVNRILDRAAELSKGCTGDNKMLYYESSGEYIYIKIGQVFVKPHSHSALKEICK